MEVNVQNAVLWNGTRRNVVDRDLYSAGPFSLQLFLENENDRFL